MKKLTIALSAFVLAGTVSQAQNKSAKPTAATTTAANAAQKETAVYSKTAGGLEYIMVKDAPGEPTAKIGDNVEMHIKTIIGDSILFESRKMNNNQPVPLTVMPPSFKGDLAEGLTLMSPGDSAIFRVSVDSLKKAVGNVPPFMKEGDKIVYEVAMVSVKSQETVKKEQDEKAAKQIGIDDQLLTDYFKKNKIKATKTSSSLYYKIDQPGAGNAPKAGQAITVNYTGKTIDGKPFDSNVDSAFHHVEPFKFNVGVGQVIKGWDEGLLLMKKGGKGTFYIPSVLAYGERSPSPAIPANSILIFDVEVKDIADAAKPAPVTPAPEEKHETEDHNH